jgi:hypothetical protein
VCSLSVASNLYYKRNSLEKVNLYPTKGPEVERDYDGSITLNETKESAM